MRNFKLFCGALIMPVVFGFPACKKAENVRTSTPKPEKKLVDFVGANSSQNRIKSIHLFKDTVYVMSQSFLREAGEQLIIDPGTLIKVDVRGSKLDIQIKPGAVIVANGTASDPIVFTSNSPAGNQKANWGGIVIQGKSINNSTNPAGDISDISGSLNFVRIEFGGLVLNSIGNNTTVENIQVSYAENQSSFEINGGTFNARNLVSYACDGPADFYITGGYAGRMQNILAYRHPFFGRAAGSLYNVLAGVLIENNQGNTAAQPFTAPVISNLTVIGPGLQNGIPASYKDTGGSFLSGSLVTARNAVFMIRNSVFLAFPSSGWYIDDTETAYNVHHEKARVSYSVFHADYDARLFFVRAGIYPPFINEDFRLFIMNAMRHNRAFSLTDDFALEDAFNYNDPKPYLKSSAPLLEGANFDDPAFSNAFFRKVSYFGAMGRENWMQGWTNFAPLKTSYNFPE